jgi:hypothetical protein
MPMTHKNAENMREFRDLAKSGRIAKAYLELISFMMSFKNRLSQKYTNRFTAGSFYQGYMDMTYFPFTPESLKKRGLKIAIVFVYENFRFEVWLAANNKKIQEDYWQLIKTSGWDKYTLVPAVQGYDSIIEKVVESDPEFGNPETLEARIENGVLEFIADVEQFFVEQDFNN